MVPLTQPLKKTTEHANNLQLSDLMVSIFTADFFFKQPLEEEQILKWIYFIALSSLSGQETHLHCKAVIINSELQQIIQHFA